MLSSFMEMLLLLYIFVSLMLLCLVSLYIEDCYYDDVIFSDNQEEELGSSVKCHVEFHLGVLVNRVHDLRKTVLSHHVVWNW